MSSKAPVPNPAASGTCPDWPAWVRNRRHVAGASRQTRLGRPHGFARFQDAEAVLAKTFVDYNEDRIHYALDYLTPSEFVCKLDGGNKWGRIHSEKSAESGIKNRGPDQWAGPR